MVYLVKFSEFFKVWKIWKKAGFHVSYYSTFEKWSYSECIFSLCLYINIKLTIINPLSPKYVIDKLLNSPS